METAITIAGFDPSGWAGVAADMKAFEDAGVRGLAAVTALTAQNTKGVTGVFPVRAAFLMRQVETLLQEFSPGAVKVGMLGTSENVSALLRLVKSGRLRNVVLDPVFLSTSGFPLLDNAGIRLIERLLPFVTLVTPNIDEASFLAGIKIRGLEDMEEAARRIHGKGAKNVLVKGGHLEGEIADVLFDGGRLHRFRSSRIKGRREIFHGTGCILSSSIAAFLAMGEGDMRAAVKKAKGRLIRTLDERKGILRGS